MITVTLTDEGKKTGDFTPRTKKGKATTIDTADFAPQINVLEGDTSGTISVNPDGTLKISIKHGTVPEGQNAVLHQLEAEYDVDRDKGEQRHIKTPIVVTLTRAEADALTGEFGEEELDTDEESA